MSGKNGKWYVQKQIYPVDMTSINGTVFHVYSNIAHKNGELPDTIEHSSKPSVVSLYWLRTGFL
jgi:hypothetical protein